LPVKPPGRSAKLRGGRTESPRKIPVRPASGASGTLAQGPPRRCNPARRSRPLTEAWAALCCFFGHSSRSGAAWRWRRADWFFGMPCAFALTQPPGVQPGR